MMHSYSISRGQRNRSSIKISAFYKNSALFLHSSIKFLLTCRLFIVVFFHILFSKSYLVQLSMEHGHTEDFVSFCFSNGLDS